MPIRNMRCIYCAISDICRMMRISASMRIGKYIRMANPTPNPNMKFTKTIENQLCSFSNRSGCWGGRHTARSQRRRRGDQRRSRGGERRREGTREGGEGDEKLRRRRKFHFPSTCQNIRFYFQLFWCVCLLAFSYMASSSSFDPLHYGKVDFWQKCIVSFEEKSLTLQPSVFYVLKNIL